MQKAHAIPCQSPSLPSICGEGKTGGSGLCYVPWERVAIRKVLVAGCFCRHPQLLGISSSASLQKVPIASEKNVKFFASLKS